MGVLARNEREEGAELADHDLRNFKRLRFGAELVKGIEEAGSVDPLVQMKRCLQRSVKAIADRVRDQFLAAGRGGHILAKGIAAQPACGGAGQRMVSFHGEIDCITQGRLPWLQTGQIGTGKRGIGWLALKPRR